MLRTTVLAIGTAAALALAAVPASARGWHGHHGGFHGGMHGGFHGGGHFYGGRHYYHRGGNRGWGGGAAWAVPFFYMLQQAVPQYRYQYQYQYGCPSYDIRYDPYAHRYYCDWDDD